MSKADDPISNVLKFRYLSRSIIVPYPDPESTVTSLVESLDLDLNWSCTKLIIKGKSIPLSTAQTLSSAGIVPNLTISILTTSAKAIEGIQSAQDHLNNLQSTPRLATAQIRKTASASPFVGFSKLTPHLLMPSPDEAIERLKVLAADPAVLYVMRLHKWHVPLLSELSPVESPDLLGLNRNKGAEIHLRLRTTDLGGWRLYTDVRRVLMHELAHNVWGDHDNNFKTLNSQLNREVAAFESSSNVVGQSSADTYRPATASSSTPPSFGNRLGGEGGASDRSMSRDDMRIMRELAAVERAAAQEREIESSCLHDR